MKNWTTTIFLTLSLFSAGCMSFDPIADHDTAIILTLPKSASKSTSQDIPDVHLVSFPGYLNQSIPVVMRQDGSLKRIPGFYWAEPLSNSVANELSIALIPLQTLPKDAFLRVRFYRFTVFDNGNAQAVLEWSVVSKEKETLRSGSETINLSDTWDPQEPATFIKGYASLLSHSAQAIRESLQSAE